MNVRQVNVKDFDIRVQRKEPVWGQKGGAETNLLRVSLSPVAGYRADMEVGGLS